MCSSSSSRRRRAAAAAAVLMGRLLGFLEELSDLSHRGPLRASDTTPTAELSPPQVRWQECSPRNAAGCRDSLLRGLSPAHKTLLPCSSADIGPACPGPPDGPSLPRGPAAADHVALLSRKSGPGVG